MNASPETDPLQLTIQCVTLRQGRLEVSVRIQIEITATTLTSR